MVAIFNMQGLSVVLTMLSCFEYIAAFRLPQADSPDLGRFTEEVFPAQGGATEILSNQVCANIMFRLTRANFRHRQCQYRRPFGNANDDETIVAWDIKKNEVQPFSVDSAQVRCTVMQSYNGCTLDFLKEHLENRQFTMFCPQNLPYLHVTGELPNNHATCHSVSQETLELEQRRKRTTEFVPAEDRRVRQRTANTFFIQSNGNSCIDL